MKDEQLYDELIALAERMDIEVIKDRGDFSGGYCRVKEDRRIVLNKHNLLPTQLRVLARNLLQFDLSNIYLLPAIREFLEQVAEEDNMEMQLEEEPTPGEEDR
jgi:hypothetical protein